MHERSPPRRVIEVNRTIIGPVTPKPKTARSKRLGDYPGVSRLHLQLARKFSSPTLIGPPICDELVALVQHLFTEDEAAVVRHLTLLKGRTVEDLARAERRPLDQIAPIVDRLAVQKRAILSMGPKQRRQYRILPLIPGVYEMVLIGETPETLSPWHRRFIELFEALFETGYVGDYLGRMDTGIRYLPMREAAGAHPAALPSDKLEVVLDRYEVFALGKCQCRTSASVVGHGCDRPLENCLTMGAFAEIGIEQGYLRPVSRQEALEVKREAESLGLVTWIMNVESTKGQCSCSCCGCCCKAMRLVNEFNAPGAFAPPHFLPQLERSRCAFCGKCAKNCPMGAITVDVRNKTFEHNLARCIGCGLCALACDAKRALSMEPVPDHKLPYRSWLALLARSAPAAMATTWRVWRNR